MDTPYKAAIKDAICSLEAKSYLSEDDELALINLYNELKEAQNNDK